MSDNKMKSLYAEESVISMMLFDKYSQNEALAILTPQDFTDSKFSIIFKTIEEMIHKGIEVDVITVVEELKTKNNLDNVGGFDFIHNLSKTVATTENISSYVNIVSEKSLARRMRDAALKIQSLMENDSAPVYDKLHSAEQEVLAVSRNYSKAGFQNANEFIESAQKNFIRKSESNSKYTGLETGFSELDSKTSGLQNSDYIILAARPSMGKTAFALNLFTQIAEKNNKPVGLFSLEMPTEQIVNRLLATRSQVNLELIKSPSKMSKGEKERLHLAADEISQLKLHINDEPSLTIGKLISSARKLHADLNQELSCIIVDYLTLISSSQRYNSYVQEVSEISSKLKQLSRELNIPIIVLSQLSRRVEMRDNKKPMMSDLRESGAIEQDADIVMFLYRDSYYNKENPDDGRTELIIGKHRNGPTGTIALAFDKKTGKFNG